MSEKNQKEISLREMLHGVPYIVVKGSPGSFEVGDHVRRESCDDSIFSRESKGWLRSDDWKGLRTRVVIDVEAIEEEIKMHRLEIARWKKILCDSG